MSQTWMLDGSDVEEVNTLLLVHGIHPALSKEALRNQFLRFGDVISSNVTVNRCGNAVGFVQMRTVRDCTTAIAGLHGHAPLHWSVQMSAPRAERLRRRRQREEARQFEEEMRPITEAKRREFEQHQHRMLQLTREFTASLGPADESTGGVDGGGVDDTVDGDIAEEPDDPSVWPLAPGQQRCTVCTAPTAGYCQRCRTPYCSTQCQRRDWEQHQHVCGLMPTITVSVPANTPTPKKPRSVEYSAGTASTGGVTADRRDANSAIDASPSPLRRPRTASGGGDAPAGSAPSKKAATQLKAPPAAASPVTRKPMSPGIVKLEAGQRYEVVVVYASEPSVVYLRLRDQLSQVQVLENELCFQVSTPDPAATYVAGQYCSGRFQNTWYRAEVEARLPDGKYRVFFVDWGNHASLDPSDMVPLSLALSMVPPQAVRATLPWRPAGADGGWSQQQWAAVAALDGQPLTASVISGPPQCSVVLFNEDGKSMLDMINEATLSVERKTAPPEVRANTPTADVKRPMPPRAELSRERRHVVAAVVMAHPQQVTAQLRDRAVYGSYLAAHQLVQKAAAVAPTLSQPPAIGTTVAVLWKVEGGGDAAWHRAAVGAADGDCVFVTLLDWGCTLELPLERVRPLPSLLCRAAAVGMQFGLHGLTADACLDERELQFYRDRLAGKEWIMELADEEGGVKQVKLHFCSDSNPYNFNEKMAQRLEASRQNTPTKSPGEVSNGSSCSVQSTSESSVGSARQRISAPPPLRHPSCPPLFLSQLPDPPLKVCTKYPFMIAHVERADLFYAVPLTEAGVEAVDRAETLVAEVVCRQMPPECPRPQRDQLVLARSAQAGEGWARAAVLQPPTDAQSMAHLLLLDHGCVELQPAAALRLLPAELARLPACLLPLTLQGADRFSEVQRQLVVKFLTGDGCEEEGLLELAVVSLGRAGAPSVVSCADINDHLLIS